jgi:sulfite reductase (ferredoxin)
MAAASWKEKLAGDMPPLWAEQIDEFEAQIRLPRAGKIDEKVFAETRLRRGAYGQRYDNGQRHDGSSSRRCPYYGLTKGPGPFFDAPGMQRIKIPFGGLNPDQMMVPRGTGRGVLRSDPARHDAAGHPVHFVHIADAPDIFRRLAAVGITRARRAATPSAM